MPVAAVFCLLIVSIQAIPTLPNMADDATIHLEANIVNKNYTVHITEYHDYSYAGSGRMRRDEADIAPMRSSLSTR